jgi:hypothetical protein
MSFFLFYKILKINTIKNNLKKNIFFIVYINILFTFAL